MPRVKPKIDTADLADVNLSIAKARLAKLEAALPPSAEPEFVRYDDLRPLHPDDRDRLKQELIDLLTIGDEEKKRRMNAWYEKTKHFAP